MRVSWAKLALGTVMAALVVAPFTSALAQTAGGETRVAIKLKDADMMTATRTLTDLSGLQFVVEPTSEPFGKITLSLSDVTAEDAIRYICTASGAYFRRDENGVYVISRTKPKEDALAGGAVPPAKAKPYLKRVRLMKADARQVFEQMMGRIPFDSLRPFEDLKKFRDFNEASTTSWKPLAPIIPGYTSSTPVTPTNNVKPGANGRENAGEIELPGEFASQLGGGLQGGGLSGGGLSGGGQGGQGGTGAQLQPGVGLVPAGIDFISYDPTDNSFIVYGTDEAIQEFIRIINEFDVAPKQVTIKVEFITTSSSVSRSLGYEFLYQRGALFTGTRPGSFIRSGDPVFLNYGTGNVTARLRTQLLTGQGKVVNAPIIRTLNNQPATIQSTVATTIFINQIISTGGGGVVISPSPFPLTISTGLAVTPRINGDGTITVALAPQISDFGQLRRGPDGQEIPDQLTQAVNVVARCRNNETIVLGGLTRKSDTGSEARVPILGDLPIIGQFFRSTTRDKNNSELLIFVTPSVVEDDESGGGNP